MVSMPPEMNARWPVAPMSTWGKPITTGARGNVQLGLTDGAMITLNEDTIFVVDDFQYDGEGGADDTVVMTMTRGTLRTITGVIGDATGDTYEMNTPFASIGVRGTEYGVVVDNTGRMGVVVFEGSITATTAGSQAQEHQHGQRSRHSAITSKRSLAFTENYPKTRRSKRLYFAFF